LHHFNVILLCCHSRFLERHGSGVCTLQTWKSKYLLHFSSFEKVNVKGSKLENCGDTDKVIKK
jgi:hypothetical protein